MAGDAKEIEKRAAYQNNIDSPALRFTGRQTVAGLAALGFSRSWSGAC